MTRNQITIYQFVSTETPTEWITWATMCTYRLSTFFKTSAFENWKFKQSLTKMIARWMTWQDFPLKGNFICIAVALIFLLHIQQRAILSIWARTKRGGAGERAPTNPTITALEAFDPWNESGFLNRCQLQLFARKNERWDQSVKLFIWVRGILH